MHDKLAYLIKHVPLIQYLYRHIMSAVFRLAGLFVRQDTKLILFSSYGGRSYNDSPKVLFEALKKDARFDDYHCVWAFENPEDFSGLPELEDCELVKIDSLAYFKTALAAKVWITNVNIERGLHFKKSSCIYLNTWHGTGPKKSGNAVKGRKDYNFSDVDILCTDGKLMHDIFMKYYNATEESMLWCGRPRDDTLITYTDEDRRNVREKLGIPEGKTAILYMPTWREYESRNINQILWEEGLGENYCVLVRAHHFTEEEMNINASGFFMDVTDYPDVNELYLAADIMVSDYSSAFWDYALLGKPMLCYAYDYDRFLDSTGLLLNMRKHFPGGVIETEEEVIEKIRTLDRELACLETEKFCKKFVNHPGSAADACLDRLWELLA